MLNNKSCLSTEYEKLYENIINSKVKKDNSINRMIELSEEGYFNASYFLAYSYHLGEFGLSQDYQKASFYYEKAIFAIDETYDDYLEDCFKGLRFTKEKLVGTVKTKIYMCYLIFKFFFLHFRIFIHSFCKIMK
jgi:hypothetical protein